MVIPNYTLHGLGW